MHSGYVFGQLEDNPHDTVAFHIIGDFLYGDTNEDVSDADVYIYVLT